MKLTKQKTLNRMNRMLKMKMMQITNKNEYYLKKQIITNHHYERSSRTNV